MSVVEFHLQTDAMIQNFLCITMCLHLWPLLVSKKYIKTITTKKKKITTEINNTERFRGQAVMCLLPRLLYVALHWLEAVEWEWWEGFSSSSGSPRQTLPSLAGAWMVPWLA